MQQSIRDAFPGPSQLKVMRRRVMQHDLDLFAAISGYTPRTEQLPTGPQEVAVRVPTAARAKAWSTAVLHSYMSGKRVKQIASKAVSPEVADWMRKLSGHAMERLHEAQDRLTTSRAAVQPRGLRKVA
jgi:hypothetical protein